LLDQAFAHCPIFLTAGPKKGPGPCLSPSVVDHSFKPTKDRGLGKLSPYLQPNLLQAYQLAVKPFNPVFKTGLVGNFL